mgnify:CR=1 FL=1
MAGLVVIQPPALVDQPHSIVRTGHTPVKGQVQSGHSSHLRVELDKGEEDFGFKMMYKYILQRLSHDTKHPVRGE